MKKQLLKSFLAVLCLMSFASKAQTYSAWGQAVNQGNAMYDDFINAGDSLKFRFTNTHATAYGNPKLVVYYEGNFGDWFDYIDIYDENLNGFNSTNTNGNDCSPEDSTVFFISPSDINTWTANNSIVFNLIPNSGSGFCQVNRVRVRLEYQYCLSGLPVAYATPSVANAFLCSTDAPVTLSGTPAGGTFSGTGVTGSTFNPANLPAGNYEVSYTATDSHTCTTTGSMLIHIKARPIVNGDMTIYACNGTSVSLDANSGGSLIWFSDAALTQSIAATHNYVTPTLTQTTNYWVAALDKNQSLGVTSVTSNSFAIIDHNNLTGDDRGGIAVTHRHVYLNGDNAAVRYDLALTPSTGISLPIRDGMFSDLRTGKLWSLWDTVLHTAVNVIGTYDVNAFRGLDSNLAFTNEYIHLSENINMESYNENSGVFAGAGVLGLYSGSTQHWYVVDMDNGAVSDLGYLSSPELRGSENWSDWGVLESTCNNGFAAIYRDYNDDNIHRRVLPNGPVTTIGTFNGLSDMASLTFNPWNSRWYFHFEGGSNTFGGSAETLGYANATGSSSVCPGNGLGCPTSVTVNVPAAVTLSVPATVICLDNGAVALTGGSPAGGTYAGIGVGTGTAGTVFFPALAGVGTFSVNYTQTDIASGCTDSAERAVTVDICTGLEKQSLVSSINVYPNPGTGSFYYTVNSDVNALQIEVTDIQGRVVYASQAVDLASGTTAQIDLNAVQAGLYFVKMTSGASQHTQRIIVAR